tara:strand:+ start:2095 stop:2610 length:516 start_codon:yes stop_codon:yes gene_type:complete
MPKTPKRPRKTPAKKKIVEESVPDSEPPEPPSIDKISKSMLEELLREELGPIGIFLRDRDYVPLTLETILRTNKLILKKLRSLGISHQPNFDCDDYSVKLIADFSVVHAQRDFKAEGFAAGLIFYADSNIGSHSRIWFVDETLKLRFIEPITALEVSLTDEEKESSFFKFG